MFNILLSSFIISYSSKFLSQIYNPIHINSNLNLQNNPDMDEYIPKTQEPLNKTSYDIKTHIPFQNSTNESIEETNRYTKFLDKFPNW
jgi:hypothetical protein